MPGIDAAEATTVEKTTSVAQSTTDGSSVDSRTSAQQQDEDAEAADANIEDVHADQVKHAVNPTAFEKAPKPLVTAEGTKNEQIVDPTLGLRSEKQARKDAGRHLDLGGAVFGAGLLGKNAQKPTNATGEILARVQGRGREQWRALIRDQNDLNKTNEQVAAEGEASLRPRPSDGKVVLSERAGYLATGYAFPTWKKWAALSITFMVQVSMNFNTSVFPNAINGISEQYDVSKQAARVTQMIFLLAYAFGCELWAPWSEELGRWPILQLSLFLVNLTQILCALAPNFGSLIVGRFLGGLMTAGGSVTLAVVADLFQPDNQQFAVGFIVLSSVGGTSVGE